MIVKACRMRFPGSAGVREEVGEKRKGGVLEGLAWGTDRCKYLLGIFSLASVTVV